MNLRDTYLGSLAIRKECIEQLSLLERIANMDPIAILQHKSNKQARKDRYKVISGPSDLLAMGTPIAADDLKIWIDTRVKIPLVIYERKEGKDLFEIYKVWRR